MSITSRSPTGPPESDRVFQLFAGRGVGPLQYYRSGRDILGLLTLPRYAYDNQRKVWVTNGVSAYVRTISGLAAEKFPATTWRWSTD